MLLLQWGLRTVFWVLAGGPLPLVDSTYFPLARRTTLGGGDFGGQPWFAGTGSIVLLSAN
jgi:hypothetical protein